MKRTGSGRIKNICAAADDIGVTRQHLHCVLTGRRVSRSLMRRWNDWQRKHAGEGNAHHGRAR